MKTIISKKTYARKEHFDLFKQMDNPHFNICLNVDITGLYTYIKEEGIGFFQTMMYVAMRALNETEAFRHRIEGDEIVAYDKINPSTTIMPKEGVFSFCSFEYDKNYTNFVYNMQEAIASIGEEVNLEDQVSMNEFVFMTSLPWLSFTSVNHPFDLKNIDSIPRVAWGKYMKQEGKVMMPFSVQAHHSLVDGYHVHQLVSHLEALMKDMNKTIKGDK